MAVNDTLAPSPKLSILANGPASFAGRKFGILVTDGAAATVLADLTGAIAAEGATFEYIAPRIGGATLDDGSKLAGKQKVGGGAVGRLRRRRHRRRRTDGAAELALHPAAKDFLTDAHAHGKFIGWTGLAPLLDATALTDKVDAGYVELTGANATGFVQAARALRVWERTLALSLPGVPAELVAG